MCQICVIICITNVTAGWCCFFFLFSPFLATCIYLCFLCPIGVYRQFYFQQWFEMKHFMGVETVQVFLIYSKLFYLLSFTLPLLLQDVWCFMILMYIFTIYHHLHLFHNMLYCTVNIIVFMKKFQCIYYCYVYRLSFFVKFYKEQNILLYSLLYMHTLSMYRGFSPCILCCCI